MPKRKQTADAANEESKVSQKSNDTSEKRRKVKAEAQETEAIASQTTQLPGKPRTARKVKTEVKEELEEDAQQDNQSGTPAKQRRRKVKEVKQEEEEKDIEEDGAVVQKKAKAKRKTKAEKEAEAMPLAARTIGHQLYIGAHVSAAGGSQRPSPSIETYTEYRLCRSSQRGSQQRAYRRQRLCSLPQVPAKMGKSTSRRRPLPFFPRSLQEPHL